MSKAGNAGIVSGHAFHSVNQQYGHVRSLNMPARHDDGDLLSFEIDAAAAANPRRVNESKPRACQHKLRIHGIARRARLGRHDHTLSAQQLIHQR